MASKKTADRRRTLANHPDVNPEMRWYLDLLNKKSTVWGTTSSTTSTTTTTTTT